MIDTIFQKYLTTRNIIFFVVMVLLIKFIASIKDVAILFFASYVIACSLNPLVDKFSKKVSRGMAAGLVLFFTTALLVAILVPLVVLAGHEIKSFVTHIPQYIELLKTLGSNLPFISKSTLASVDLGDFISSASGVTSKFVNQSINASMNFAQAIVYFVAAGIIIYYFMADKEEVKQAYMSLFPVEMKEKADEIIETISKKIGGYVVAQIVTMASVGIVMTIGLLLLKVEYAVLLGLITAILDIVPVVGPAIALVICLVSASKTGLLTLALICVVFSAAQLIENNFVRPYIFGKFLDLHPLIIYMFLFITAQHLGVVGVIFAPAIAATVCVLIEELYIKNMN